MNNRNENKTLRTIKDVINVSISNLVKLFSGVLVGFLLPKIIGISDYGYYKTFTLYASYVGLFGIGIVDGIYLKYGGKSYHDLDRKKFRLFSKVIIVIQLLFCFLGIIVALILFEDDLSFIFICVAVYLFVGNVTGYYQIISQITGRFTELSFRNIIYSVLTAISVLALWLAGRFFHLEISYRYYTFLYVAIFALLAIWYSYTYRDITFGKSSKLSNQLNEIACFIKSGIPLLIANLCSTLVLTLDRQFVNILFDNTTYAIYAFAYNMLALVTTATGAISTVIYPVLRNKSNDELIKQYPELISLILVIVFVCLLGYFPLCWFVDLFLPQYHDSLAIFRIIFPGLSISSAITIVMHNYYKIIGENMRYFIYSVLALFISTIANYCAYTIWKTTASISIASVFTLIVWYIIVERYFVKRFKIPWVKNILYLVTMLLAFYVITGTSNYYIGFIVHTLVSITITFLFNKKRVVDLYHRRHKI